MWAGPGITGLLGTGPERCRSARPRVKSSGPQRVQRTQRNAEPVLQTPVARPTGRLPSLQTHSPARTFAAEGPGTTGRALRASLSLIPLLLQGHTGGG